MLSAKTQWRLFVNKNAMEPLSGCKYITNNFVDNVPESRQT
jgi:hypothetical protein